ncbi:MAG: glycerophosphodiester phosphodiesterase [Bacteroidales bacterium]|nr:glycerophosphodiester phosphodiesterase [Bacteroidales bacterium]
MKKRISLALLTLSSLALYATPPAVVAHRGYWNTEGSAQNSIRSLVKADSIGCEYTEFDVWLTSDNVPVVNHDDVIDGMVIQNTPYHEVAKARLSNGEPVPRLDQFLDTAAPLKVGLVLELKPHADPVKEVLAAGMIARMIAERDLEPRTMYITFSANALKALQATTGQKAAYLSAVSPEELVALDCYGPDFNIGSLRQFPQWIDEFRSLGMPLNVWTVDSDDDIQWCIDNGATYITTNNPLRAQELIASGK